MRPSTDAPSPSSGPRTAQPVEIGSRGGADEASEGCRAPSASLYFDTRGKVRACCQNRGGYLGDVTRQSLREIWEGAEADRMRRELAAGSFPQACSFCAWQVREGHGDALFARSFDHLAGDEDPRWPSQMEFALTNTCNLQCVMCSGDYSSAIRSHREGRPPLPVVYEDAFFEELAEFLPHLRHAKFYGGEPLLGREPTRVLDMLADLDEPPATVITTNATVWNPRIERMLARLEPSVVVSLDGATTETFDQIRKGAHLPEVLVNIERYRKVLGTANLSLTTCLMVQNHHEFVDLLNLSSAWEVFIGVNVVHHPLGNSLYNLPTAELDRVIEGLARQRPSVAEDRLDVFDVQVQLLRNRLDVLRGSGSAASSSHRLPVPTFTVAAQRSSRWSWLPFAEVDGGACYEAVPVPRIGLDVVIGTDGLVHEANEVGATPTGWKALVGGTVEELQDEVIGVYGAMEGWWLEAPEPVADRATVRPGGAADSSLVVTIEARRDADGRLTGARYVLDLSPTGLEDVERAAARR